MNVQFNIDGDPKATLLFGFAFKHDKLSDELLGSNIDKANALLFQYGAFIVGFHHHDDDTQVIDIKTLTQSEVSKAKFIADEYETWLIGTGGPSDFPPPSPEVVEQIRKKCPCPVKPTLLSNVVSKLDPGTFQTKLVALMRTDDYKLQLWDWKHSARYAGFFAEEETPDLSELPQETVRHYFSLP